MVELKTDRELLRGYAENGSESCFEAVVERHLDLVFATSLRGLNDTGAAQEITQNVFVTLARKAAWLTGETSLAGWLHKAALLEVRRWWRGELRRQKREQTAVGLGTIMKDEDSLLKALAGELDEGLLELREPDRQALMLRYFEGRSHREIGALLGAREDAVRKRIDGALARLTRFFRRRGYAVPAVATTAAALGAAAKAAPAGLAVAAAHSALAAGGGALTGLKPLVVKFMALTKTQTALLCVALAAAPLAWEWNVNRMLRNRAAVAQSKLQAIHDQQDLSTADLDRLRAESAGLEAALAEAMKNETRYEAAARKLDALTARVKGLLTDANYRWPDDLPYARVPKRVIKPLDILNRWPGTFKPSGAMNERALELLGITAQEKAPTEQALSNYWRGAQDLMTANAYETNLPAAEPGRLTKTVIVPPLGQPLTALAGDARAQLTDILGAEREQLLFAGWDEGAIQIFWPGNLWNISEVPQTFTVWVDPAAPNNAPRYGCGWHQGPMGVSFDTGGGGSPLSELPRGIATQFFAPWLGQFGIKTPTQFCGEQNE